MRTLDDLKHLTMALSLAATVFGITACWAYYTAYTLITTGSSLVRVLM